MRPMALLLNLLWLLFGGVWMAVAWGVAAVIMAITIIGLPWARAAFNIGVWMGMLSAVAALLGGGIALRAYGRRVLANVIRALLAAPGALYALLVLLIVVMQPNWR